jgi:aryl-alcohol dehydrogenase-like predicted oxidoreductase
MMTQARRMVLTDDCTGAMKEDSMSEDFTRTTLGRTGLPVFRLGLSGTYRPGKETIHRAIDAGVNYFFGYGFDGQMIRTLREVFKTRREQMVVSTGAYNLLVGHPDLRRTLEKRLRQLGTDYIDVFLFLGVNKPKHIGERELDEMRKFRDEGKVRAIGISCHDRKLIGKFVGEGAIDVTMMRYNAAHRGAEEDIFPYLAKHDPGVVSYTATRWSYLLRRPSGYPKDAPIPTADQCYRFVLSNPHVDVCLTAPANARQLEENLAGLSKGPLTPDEMRFMREFGDIVHARKKYFM